MHIPARLCGLAAAALVSLPHAVLAKDDPHFYVGAGLGQAKVKDACEGLSNCDDTDTAWKLFAGYQFNPFLALEGGYIDLGKASVSGAGTDPVLGTYSGSVSVDAWGAFFSAVLTIPLGNHFGIFAKAGAAYTDATGKLQGSSSVYGSGSFSESDDGVDFTFGAGANVNFGRFTVRAEWERFDGVGGDFDGDVDVISASLIYRF